MNIHVEALLRSIAIFLGVFFTYRWVSKSEPAYDLLLATLAVMLAITLNHYGPLKM